MALNKTALGNALADLEPTDVEATAASRLATAWDSYFRDASVSGVPISGPTTAARAAMLAALSGLSTTGLGPNKIQAGIIAYWGVIGPASATLWVLAPTVVTALLPPPTLSGIAAALLPVFVTAAQDELSLEEAAQKVADVLHTTGGLGATVTLVPPLPAAPVPSIPIL